MGYNLPTFNNSEFDKTLTKYNHFINLLEKWKIINGFERYEISNLGKVWIIDSGQIILKMEI